MQDNILLRWGALCATAEADPRSQVQREGAGAGLASKAVARCAPRRSTLLVHRRAWHHAAPRPPSDAKPVEEWARLFNVHPQALHRRQQGEPFVIMRGSNYCPAKAYTIDAVARANNRGPVMMEADSAGGGGAVDRTINRGPPH